jgi:hypothetical protein
MARVQRADDDVGRLVSGRLSRTAAGEVCPDAEVLAAYVDSGLADEEIARVEAHLATCASCRALMARLSPIDAAAPAAAPTVRFFSIDARWGALAATFLVAAVAWMVWPRATPGPAMTMARQEVAAPGGAAPGGGAGAPPAASPNPVPAGPQAMLDAAPPPRARAQAARSALPAAPPAAVAKQEAAVAALAEEGARAVERREADLQSARAARPNTVAGRDLARVAAPPPAATVTPPPVRPDAPAPAPVVAAAQPVAAPRPPSPAAAEPEARNAAADRQAQKAADASRDQFGAGGRFAKAEAERAATGQTAVAQAAASSMAITESPWPTFAEPEGRLRWRIVQGRFIESSSDGGTTWNRSFAGRGITIVAGSAPSMSAAWACGANGVVLRRAVPGEWTLVKSPSSEDLVSIAATSDAVARVTTRSRQVFETTDGGATWTAR